ncbi:hypothetical protein SAG0136_00550 [Streptococcus agalactiae LMG 14747]|uniref:Uncharacterized protein n=1 Tax=Streptococcus agalactiae LMG 14747 TaxID=1154860 RepID=V6YYJ5_STRAG|nr:hypothetical protein SAG0136_00550 [Streptococcus agalactiae LMG 14747]
MSFSFDGWIYHTFSVVSVGTGISLTPKSKWGYYGLASIYMIAIVVVFGIYLIVIFPGLEELLHQLTSCY